MLEGVNADSSIASRLRSFGRTRFARDVLVPYSIARITLLLVGFAATLLLPRPPSFVAEAIALVDALIRWDSIHYLSVAELGYGHGSDAFFPLYPLLVCGVGLAMPLPYAAVVVSNVAAVLALGLLRRFVDAEHGAHVARRAVAMAVLFPTSFFLSVAYSESTYLACLLGAFVAAREDRRLLAALAVFLACLARPQGFLCATVPFVLAWLLGSRSRRTIPWFVAASIPALVLLLGVHYAATRDPLGFLHAESVRSLGIFWRDSTQPAPAMLTVLFDEGIGSNLVRRILNVASLALVVTTALVESRRKRADLAAVALLSVALPLFFQRTIFDAASMARYTLLAFPVFVLLARGTANRTARRVVDLAFPMMQLVLFLAFTESVWAE